MAGWKVPLAWQDRPCKRPIGPGRRITFQVVKRSWFYPCPMVVSECRRSGRLVLLTETIRVAGLDVELRAGLARWRRPAAVPDPRMVVGGLGGDPGLRW